MRMHSFSSITGDVGFKFPSLKEMAENAAALRKMAMKMDRPEEIICSQEFFDSLSTEAQAGPIIHGIARLPVRVETALAAKTAIVRYRSGKMVYLTPDGPRRTPEEEAAAMEKFMAAEPLGGLFDLGFGLLDRDESKEQNT